jgi:hypothetical protein
VEDLVLLPKVTEEGIVENIKKRYMGDKIYVRIWSLFLHRKKFVSHLERCGTSQRELDPFSVLTNQTKNVLVGAVRHQESLSFHRFPLYYADSLSFVQTNIGPVLISVNPFKRIPNLCDDAQVDDYKNRFRHEVPPNIFALAEEAYRAMKNQQENQCVIITCVVENIFF